MCTMGLSEHVDRLPEKGGLFHLSKEGLSIIQWISGY